MYVNVVIMPRHVLFFFISIFFFFLCYLIIKINHVRFKEIKHFEVKEILEGDTTLTLP